MSAAQIIAQLTAASQSLEVTQAKLQEAGEAASQARTLVSAALQGSSGQLASQIGVLVESLGQISSKVPTARQQVHQTITKVKALGN